MVRNSSVLVTFALLISLQGPSRADVLGTATDFAVLAGSTVTNTGPTVVFGNVGVWAGSSITGFPRGLVLGGTIHVTDGVAQQAQSDVTTAYNALASMAPDQNLSGQDLGGLTLTPGVYRYSAAAQLTGTLTLDGQGDPDALFVFQIVSALTTASNSMVTLINGASSCNVYWQVGSSAVLNTDTTFQGNILALTSISLKTGTTILDGRALARNGAVTLETNLILAGCLCVLNPTSDDCNTNDIPDECDIRDGTSEDCNLNGIPDECEQLPDCCGQSGDCDDDGISDACEIEAGAPDNYGVEPFACRPNGVPDRCEEVDDCDGDGTPDACEPTGGPDCNKNGIPDECDIFGGPSTDCNLNGIPDECEQLPNCDDDNLSDACEILEGAPDNYGLNPPSCSPNGVPDECEPAADCDGDGIPDACEILAGARDNYGLNPGSCSPNGVPDVCEPAPDCDSDGIPDACEILVGAPDCNENGVPDICDGGCDLDCVDFDRFENLTPNDTFTAITNFHNPQTQQGYVYAFAVNGADVPVAFDWLVGQIIVIDGVDTFDYGVNALDFRAAVAQGALTDIDGDGVRDLNGSEYERAPGELLVPRFLGQRIGELPSKLILIGLSGGTNFDTNVDFQIFNDNEEGFSAEHIFRCWDKVELLQISGAFNNSFLKNSTNDAPGESIGPYEYGWFRMQGGNASSASFSIQDPAIYGVYLERIRSITTAELPFERCTRSGHLLPQSDFGDNEEQAAGGASNHNCSSDIPRRRPASLLLYPEFDNRPGRASVLTITNTNPSAAGRVHMIYIGRFSG